jgi:hypothetical protein
MTRREYYRPIIAKVLGEMAGKPEREIRKALRDAFPHPPHDCHPYKTWLDEVRVQRRRNLSPAELARRGRVIADKDARYEPIGDGDIFKSEP